MDIGVRSEVGRLRAVLVHRPDLELRRLTPGNMDELLFDELLWVDRAQEEHDAFVEVLQGGGAEVLDLARLLADVLADRAAVEGVVATLVNERTCGPTLADRVRGFLLALPTSELVRHLIGGVSFEEMAAGGEPEPEGLVARAYGPWELLLQPLPNTVFTRDSSAWIGEGVVIAPMNRLVRRRESQLLRLVYELHPRFAGSKFWYGDEPVEYFPATFEGGDLLVVGDRGVAIGMSERTTPQGVEILASRLFANGVVDRVAAVDLPKARSTMHLDTVVTMVDRDAFLMFPRIRAAVRAHRLTPAAGGAVRVDDGGDLVDALAWAAGLDEARAIEPDLHSVAAEREQWNDANNVFALGPGEVVAYERNVATNATLEEAGIAVHRIPSQELPRGRGGPRCMTCPVARDAL